MTSFLPYLLFVPLSRPNDAFHSVNRTYVLFSFPSFELLEELRPLTTTMEAHVTNAILREIHATLKFMHNTMDERLEKMEKHQTHLAREIATLLQDSHITRTLVASTVAKLQVRQFARDNPAVERVFGTNELLELILLQLDFFHLARAQRISSRFKLLIDTSIVLQHALFLAPAPDPFDQRDLPPHINPLMRQSLGFGSAAIQTTESRPSLFFLRGDLKMPCARGKRGVDI